MKAASPSFIEIEFTTALPCRHLRPASITENFDESTITGTRAMSGSAAIRLRKLIMVCSESSSPSSMLTSITCAPFSTCPRATESRPAQLPRPFRHFTRRLARYRLGDGSDVLGRRATAAADHVDQASLGEFAEQLGHIFRALVVLTEFVRQPGVRISADEGIGDAADLSDVGAHLARAERAVETDGDRIGVAHRIPERRRRLPGQQTAGAVRYSAGDHHWDVKAALTANLLDGVDRRLGIERIEDGLD